MKTPVADPEHTAQFTSSAEGPGANREFWFLLVGLTLLYVVVVAIGSRRFVWYDELFTFDIARSTSIRQLWNRELRFDAHTPTGYLLSRISMSIFGPTPFGLRLPSMVEFYFGSVAILMYVKRKAGVAFAGVAVIMVWAAAPTLFLAVEARPYALIFACFACLLLSWDTAIRVHPRSLALCGIAISTVSMSAAHLFAPLVLFSFVVAEAVRFWRRREHDYALWAALLLPMLIMFIYIPLIRATEGVIFAEQPSFASVGKFFEDTLCTPVMFLVVMAALLAPEAKTDREISGELFPEEFVLLACLLFSPILMNVFLIHRHKTFYDRYGIASQAAIVAALSIFLAYRFRFSRLAARAASTVLLIFLVRYQVWRPLRSPAPLNAEVLASVEPKLPIVVGGGMAFIEMNHHEGPAVTSRLYFLKDTQESHYTHGNFYESFEAPDLMKAAGFPIPGTIEQYSNFVSQHRQFLLFGSPGDLIFVKLREDGASMAYLYDYTGVTPYSATILYRVTIPAQNRPGDF